jgi:hypothetical protein
MQLKSSQKRVKLTLPGELKVGLVQ